MLKENKKIKCILCNNYFFKNHHNQLLCSDICKLKRQFYKNQSSFIQRKYKNFKQFDYNKNKSLTIIF